MDFIKFVEALTADERESLQAALDTVPPVDPPPPPPEDDGESEEG